MSVEGVGRVDLRVTVLIAAYDAAGFIGRAIQSAVTQEPAPLEVLVVDDRSNDETAAVVRAMASQQPLIRLISLPVNVGPSGARNAGLAAARGDWIAVLDADDAFLPGRLAALAATAGANNADIVADNFRYFDARASLAGDVALKQEAAEEVIDQYELVKRATPFGDEADYGMLKPMFRKAFLDERNLRYPAGSRHGEDFLFALDIVMSGGRYVLNRTPYYLYTTRDSGMSRTQVDYDKVAFECQQLLSEERVIADAQLAEAVSRRVLVVRRLSAERKVVSLIVGRDAVGLIQLCFGDRWARMAVLRRIARRVFPCCASETRAAKRV